MSINCLCLLSRSAISSALFFSQASINLVYSFWDLMSLSLYLSASSFKATLFFSFSSSIALRRTLSSFLLSIVCCCSSASSFSIYLTILQSKSFSFLCSYLFLRFSSFNYLSLDNFSQRSLSFISLAFLISLASWRDIYYYQSKKQAESSSLSLYLSLPFSAIYLYKSALIFFFYSANLSFSISYSFLNNSVSNFMIVAHSSFSFPPIYIDLALCEEVSLMTSA